MTKFYHTRLNHALIDNEVTQLNYISIKSLLTAFLDAIHDCQPENYTQPATLRLIHVFRLNNIDGRK